MSKIYYRLIEGGENGVDNVVAFDPTRVEPMLQADSNHPHWVNIVKGLKANDTSVFDLFDVQIGVVTSMQALSERIGFDGYNITFDGDVQSGPLATHLMRCIEAGTVDYGPVVRFWEKVAQNPDDNSRGQLFTWLQSHDFTITEDGDILGYKGVVGYNEGEFLSSHSGTAFVDGVEITGRIPNNPGTVVTMPRSKVRNDPNTHCSYGLHVGDWSYASTFTSGATLEVHVNPRDVVSIPNDHSCKKMRTCRYKVVKVRDTVSQSPISIESVEDNWVGDVGYSPL